MFTVVAERINCTRKAIREATENRDADFIRSEAVAQAAAGATYIDVNAGAHPDTELANLQWLLAQVQAATDLPLSLDSANPDVLAAGLAALDDRPALLNSVSLETEKLRAILPLAQQYNASIVGLCLDDSGMPDTADARLENATRLLAAARAAGIDDDRVYLDPLVRCVSTEHEQGAAFLRAIRLIRDAHPRAHFCAGISNVSFGLPQRTVLNRAFLGLAIWEGLDGAIIDPTDTGVMGQLYATRALIGQDEFCLAYMTAARAGALV